MSGIQFQNEQDKQEFLEDFRKRFALCGSDKVGEAQAGLNKATLLCDRRGFPFLEVVTLAYGSGDGAELRDELQRQAAEYSQQMQWAQQEMDRLHDALALAQSAGYDVDGDGEKEHVIDLPGRLRRAWSYPQFRLFLLTLVLAFDVGMAAKGHPLSPRAVGVVAMFMFGAWSLAQYRKRGLAQLFLKWLVFITVIVLGRLALNAIDGPYPVTATLCLQAAALLLTLTKLSNWIGQLIRIHIWESSFVKTMRGWFE